MNVILFLLLLGAGIWFWLDSARAREIATALAARACESRELQFLDQTVSLSRLGLRWTGQGVRVRRMFRFDYSEGGEGRLVGYVILVGTNLEIFQFHQNNRSADVIPLHKRNLH
ncbi:MAG: DUF3301 domain-containing protein [Gammaproteobacteria bacterium]|nr:DUF3301 domain-containing protein [Gammaproteobacteria bacterium]